VWPQYVVASPNVFSHANCGTRYLVHDLSLLAHDIQSLALNVAFVACLSATILCVQLADGCFNLPSNIGESKYPPFTGINATKELMNLRWLVIYWAYGAGLELGYPEWSSTSKTFVVLAFKESKIGGLRKRQFVKGKLQSWK
jgi:hypothetical protein